MTILLPSLAPLSSFCTTSPRIPFLDTGVLLSFGNRYYAQDINVSLTHDFSFLNCAVPRVAYTLLCLDVVLIVHTYIYQLCQPGRCIPLGFSTIVMKCRIIIHPLPLPQLERVIKDRSTSSRIYGKNHNFGFFINYDHLGESLFLSHLDWALIRNASGPSRL